MTSIEKTKIKSKITRIKKTFAEEKKKFGFYHNGSGSRYIPPSLYIQLQDYQEGLNYLKWFKKTFPDDAGFPEFLFDWTIILFKTGDLKKAEKKAIESYFRNTYFFDKYFGKPIIPIDKYEFSSLESPDSTQFFVYSHKQDDLKDFSQWLKQIVDSDKFQKVSKQFINIKKKFKIAEDERTLQSLIKQEKLLLKNY